MSLLIKSFIASNFLIDLELPVKITVPLQPEISVKDGGQLVLKAEVSKPNVPGTWFKDDLEILPDVDKKYDIGVDGTVHSLTIHQVSPDDRGEYTLEIGEDSTTTVATIEGLLKLLFLLYSLYVL